MSSASKLTAVPPPEAMTIEIRAYTQLLGCGDRPAITRSKPLSPSRRTLVFDCETGVDAAQQLRFGAYLVTDASQIREQGLFYEPQALHPTELSLLQKFARTHALPLHTRAEFVEEVFFPVAYDDEGTVVGFNLPFDLSRIAISHGSARRTMRGGFTFRLSEKRWRPYVQVKHISTRAALIRFSHPSKQLMGRGMRNRGLRVQPHRGHFVDLKTAAAALTSRSHSLASLGDYLEVQHRKREADRHGGSLTESYLGYGLRDVQCSWECYRELLARYKAHGLSDTPLEAMKSEASLGKAYLRKMGISPWRQVQPKFPNELLGLILSTYYGGRSEVRMRREIVEVLYFDFLSMYPTVCTLMALWRFVTAEGVIWRDTTKASQELIESVTLANLQKPSFWKRLSTLVRVIPQGDVLPVRAQYGQEQQSTIALNYLTSSEPLWFTLADCIASKLLTGRAPRVLEAVGFKPKKRQSGLQPIAIDNYQVDPSTADFYRTLIDLRSDVKKRLKQAKLQTRHGEADRLNCQQNTLKTLVNATSYGIFVETIIEELEEKSLARCFGGQGAPFLVETTKAEKPGAYFHPLLATLITGAARLVLAISEKLIENSALNWAFCDTDSVVVARPDDMSRTEFIRKARNVQTWFDPLNPYREKGHLLKLEEQNFAADGTLSDPLYCFAISAKRHALSNIGAGGKPVIRKASAHGLGHLFEPYTADDAPHSIPEPSVPLSNIGVDRWQYDLWYQIISAVLAGRPEQPFLDHHPALNQPAISRYGATTPRLLSWFKNYNAGRPYLEQVRPFGFLTCLHASQTVNSSGEEEFTLKRPGRMPRPIAPFQKEPAAAAEVAFDRDSGRPVCRFQLATYRQVLAQFHLHPEAKFRNADYTDRGITQRRHVLATSVAYIGKEANRWEEQFFLGLDERAAIGYGSAPGDLALIRERIIRACGKHGQRAVARAARVSLRDVSALIDGTRLKSEMLQRLDRAAAFLLETIGVGVCCTDVRHS